MIFLGSYLNHSTSLASKLYQMLRRKVIMEKVIWFFIYLFLFVMPLVLGCSKRTGVHLYHPKSEPKIIKAEAENKKQVIIQRNPEGKQVVVQM